jgi:hypothetical protein
MAFTFPGRKLGPSQPFPVAFEFHGLGPPGALNSIVKCKLLLRLEELGSLFEIQPR